MAYILDSVSIRAPIELIEINSTQIAQHRVITGPIRRKFFGDNKRIWQLSYANSPKDDYDAIKTIYDSYLDTNTAKSWEITETNYTVASTNVHIDLLTREFNRSGPDYISDFVLLLVEV